MPRDAEFGRDLATQLQAMFGGWINDVEFTYDAFVELDRLDPAKSWCKITTNLYQHVRESRYSWRETVQLMLTLVAPVGVADNPTEIDTWLDSWDTVVRQTRELKVLGRHKPISVDTEERYDAEMFHKHRRMVTQAAINYANVEVM
jgi:hypothetical protein